MVATEVNALWNTKRRTSIVFFCLIVFCFYLIAYNTRTTSLDYGTETTVLKSNTTSETTSETTSQTENSPWDRAMIESDTLLLSKKSLLPSCLVPNTAKTKRLVKDILVSMKQQHGNSAMRKTNNNSNTTATSKGNAASLVPLPALNLGMPKCGSQSLFDFFECAGYEATHRFLNTDHPEALCMRDAAKIQFPPLATCANQKDAMLQLDFEFPFGHSKIKKNKEKEIVFESKLHRDDCFFPQLSLLEEIHQENPNATFLLVFRPAKDWISSLINFEKRLLYFRDCDFPNLPRGIPNNIEDRTHVFETFERFLCSHILHVRNFVEAHPSHALIELDLYDTEANEAVLGALFPFTSNGKESSNCWGHSSHKGDLHKADWVPFSQ